MERPKRVIHQPVSYQHYLTNSDEDEEEEKHIVVKKLTDDPIHTSEKKLFNQFDEKTPAKISKKITDFGGKGYKCNNCGKLLSSQHALNEHTNIHTDYKPHKCKTCRFESRHLSVYLRHIMTHDNSKGFVCSVCGKSFKMNQYLQRHLRKHTGEKCCFCSICDKGFTCKSELNRHKKRHSTDRPHKCSICNKQFKMLHNLRSHKNKCAGEHKYECSVCSQIFTKQKLLEIHKKSHYEGVQHLQVTRPKEDLLVVSISANDRRRLPSFHSVKLPQEALNSFISSEKCNKFFRVQDFYVPLNMLLDLCGKGNSLQIKIIDQNKSFKQENNQLVVEIINNKTSKGEDYANKTSITTEKNLDPQDCISCDIEESVNKNTSTSERILAHCSSGFAHQVFDHNYITWMNTLISLCKELIIPIDQVICEELVNTTTILQNTFLKHSVKVKLEADDDLDIKPIKINTTVVQPIDKELENGIKIKTDLSKSFTVSTKDLRTDISYMVQLHKGYGELHSILNKHWEYVFKYEVKS